MRDFTSEEKEQYTKSINKVYKPTGYNIYGKRELTQEEKELIINTPITIDCFEKWNDYHYEQVILKNFPHPSLEKGKTCTAIFYPTTIMESHINCCEEVRTKYLETKDEHYFDILVCLLPNSYKVVKL